MGARPRFVLLALEAPPRLPVADVDALVAGFVAEARAGDYLVVMSNGGFGGLHEMLLDRLGRTAPVA